MKSRRRIAFPKAGTTRRPGANELDDFPPSHMLPGRGCTLPARALLCITAKLVGECPLCAKSGLMQCSIRSPRCCVGIFLIRDPPLAVSQPALGEHFHVDFVLVGPITNNLD